MTIAIACGKGGTGKTTFTVALGQLAGDRAVVAGGVAHDSSAVPQRQR